VLCGKGNNGGDGLAAARYLAREGIVPEIVLLAAADRVQGDAARNLALARAAGLHVREVADEDAWIADPPRLVPPRMVLDAILGTGVRGGARGLAARAISDLNGCGARVVSIDLPSGLDADTATVENPAVRAARTYALARPKPALVFWPAAAHAGELRVLPIGIPDEAVRLEESALEWLDVDAAAPLLPQRAADSHKGSYGHLLAVAGSRGKSGAAVLTARGALRTGVGLVTVATPASCQSEVAMQQAELMTEPLPDGASGGLAAGSPAIALELLASRSALALGPGLGQEPATQAAALQILAGARTPVVVDADALNALAAAGPSWPERLPRHVVVLTPHPGEAARLLDRTTAAVQCARLAAVRELAARSGAVVVLKGHRTLIGRRDGHVAINASGNPGMAAGGMGDVLTGVIGALLARGLEPFDAARLAVFAHGDAGDRCAHERGQDGMLATDVAAMLPQALAALHRRPS
jgi:NAD(P)H-hydrate epimerase